MKVTLKSVNIELGSALYRIEAAAENDNKYDHKQFDLTIEEISQFILELRRAKVIMEAVELARKVDIGGQTQKADKEAAAEVASRLKSILIGETGTGD